MEEGYKDNPLNFNVIDRYVIQCTEQIVQEMLTAGKCFFYDTCSFRYHAHLKQPEYLFEFIKRQQGIVIVTRSVVMELASHSAMLNEEYMAYIRKMHEAGIKILVIYEEDVFAILSACFSANSIINRYLSLAVKTVKTATGVVTEVLKSNEKLRLDVLVKESVRERNLFSDFFKEVRLNKKTGDNLGEELIAICLQLLSHIPENVACRYIVMTDDKGAIGLLNKTMKNVLTHEGIQSFTVFSTPKLAQKLYDEDIMREISQVADMLETVSADGELRIFGSEEYDIEAKTKTMSCMELAEKIAKQGAIHINY